MWSIEFMAPFGDERKLVQVYETGTGNSFYVIMDKYFEGQINWMLFGWRADASSDKSLLQGDDVMIIIDIIEAEYPNPNRKVTRLTHGGGSGHPYLRSPMDANRNRICIGSCNVYVGRRGVDDSD